MCSTRFWECSLIVSGGKVSGVEFVWIDFRERVEPGVVCASMPSGKNFYECSSCSGMTRVIPLSELMGLPNGTAVAADTDPLKENEKTHLDR